MKIVLIVCLLSVSLKISAQEHPNVLWLVFEDASPYLLPVYGNDIVKTPNIDQLAAKGVVYKNAFSVGPQCSPARSTLISGCNATTWGTDLHREARPVPESIYFFPKWLRESGYYCTNIGKTDYNSPKENEAEILQKVWDRNGAGASYQNAERGEKPFFSMYNNYSTHTSRVATVNLANRVPCRIKVGPGELPAHVPDLPALRADYALQLEGIEDVDRWVGIFLKDLQERALMENTIIFLFSDHGGSLPRGKGFSNDTGERAALIVYVPQKWQHLWDETPGSYTDRMVTFADFGPTVLSIAGVKTPEHMQGKPFMGTHRDSAREYAHCFKANMGNHFDPSRSVYQGRYHYIRYFTPHKIPALRHAYKFGMPGQVAWDSLFHFTDNCPPEHQQFFSPMPYEALYDLSSDPWELDNLAADPQHLSKVKELRAEVYRHQHATRDLGLLPMTERRRWVENGGNLYDNIRKAEYPLNQLLDLAAFASDEKNISAQKLEPYLLHPDASFRFWAASGFGYLYSKNKPDSWPAQLNTLLDDSCMEVSAAAAEALVYAGEESAGMNALIEMCDNKNFAAASALEQLSMNHKLNEKQLDRLETIMHKDYVEYEGGFSVRSIMVNYGRLPVEDIFSKEKQAQFVSDYHMRLKRWNWFNPNQ